MRATLIITVAALVLSAKSSAAEPVVTLQSLLAEMTSYDSFPRHHRNGSVPLGGCFVHQPKTKADADVGTERRPNE
jgi:hypothetical protein